MLLKSLEPKISNGFFLFARRKRGKCAQTRRNGPALGHRLMATPHGRTARARKNLAGNENESRMRVIASRVYYVAELRCMRDVDLYTAARRRRRRREKRKEKCQNEKSKYSCVGVFFFFCSCLKLYIFLYWYMRVCLCVAARTMICHI